MPILLSLSLLLANVICIALQFSCTCESVTLSPLSALASSVITLYAIFVVMSFTGLYCSISCFIWCVFSSFFNSFPQELFQPISLSKKLGRLSAKLCIVQRKDSRIRALWCFLGVLILVMLYLLVACFFLVLVNLISQSLRDEIEKKPFPF